MTTPLTIAQRLGATPAGERLLPAVNLAAPSHSAIARAIATNLPHQPHALYRRQDKNYITIRTALEPTDRGAAIPTVKVDQIDADTFCSWVEQYACFRAGADEDSRPCTLSPARATIILKSPTFIAATPEVREIAGVRLPQWAPDTPDTPASSAKPTRRVRLAPAGYDPRTLTYTATTLDYADELPEGKFSPATLRRVWANLVKDYPFRPESPAEEAAGIDPCHNRSACAALAVMLGQYTRNLHARIPMAIINGNQPGTGKTLLAWMLLAVTWGVLPGTAKPQDDEEMTKTLNTSVLDGDPFVFLDDVANLASPIINMFATAPCIKGRILGKNTTFTAANNCQIVATGNGLTTTPDVERRSLIIDLFCAENATQRPIKSPTEKEAFADPAWRAQMLTFCAALVANWNTAGCPLSTARSAKPSFESFAQVVGSIMAVNGFGDPFRQRVTDGDGGDLIGRAIETLVCTIASRQATLTNTYRLTEIIEVAEELGYMETITAGAKDQRKSIGRRLRPYRNRKLTDLAGRPFIFGRGEDAASSNYTFQLLTP